MGFRLFPLLFVPDAAATETYPLSLHDALPISTCPSPPEAGWAVSNPPSTPDSPTASSPAARSAATTCRFTGPPMTSSTTSARSEEHTSELQSHSDLVCRLLLEKKNKTKKTIQHA